MSPNIRLPPELCDQVIDHLWNDLDALRACSLTCNDWLPSSRYHLFRNVRLRNSDDVTRFRALVDSNQDLSQLKSEIPALLRCLQRDINEGLNLFPHPRIPDRTMSYDMSFTPPLEEYEIQSTVASSTVCQSALLLTSIILSLPALSTLLSRECFEAKSVSRV